MTSLIKPVRGLNRSIQYISFSSCCCLLIMLFFFSGPSHALTPDGEPPSVETFCDNFKGKAAGMCNAYCEATDCGDFSPVQASSTACDVLGTKFVEASGLVDDMGEPAVCKEALETCDAEALAECLNPPSEMKIVFVTNGLDGPNGLTQGTGRTSGNMGGLAGADAICQAEANAAGIGGARIYKAWLSTTVDPDSGPGDGLGGVDRFASNQMTAIFLADGTTMIAANIDGVGGLFDTELIANPINEDALGNPVVFGEFEAIWTNTLSKGEPSVSQNVGTEDCVNWTFMNGKGNAHPAGLSGLGWSSIANQIESAPCDDANRLYCFEQ